MSSPKTKQNIFTDMKKLIIIAVFLILMYGCLNSEDDQKTVYKSEWETCTVIDTVGNTTTLECNNIIKYVYSKNLFSSGETVELRTDYEIYQEILK